MKGSPEKSLGFLAGLSLSCALSMPVRADTQSTAPVADDALSLAICPIVYPLDQSPSDRGFHYLFYGNGFFINQEGYLLTAAHVLSQLTDGEPYIVLRLPMAPPRLLKATVVAIDQDHDVALLRVTPNPFEGKYQVRFLPLAVERPPRADAVLSAALRPSRLKDPHTFDAFVEDRPAGQVVEYEFSQLDKGHPDTELLLFSHDVLLGDSGAPVTSAESHAVVGLVEGRWLRPAAASIAMTTMQSHNGVGAAIPIHYAIPLLQQRGVTWHASDKNASSAQTSHMPIPLSLVAAPYPTQALQGGEVILQSEVDHHGLLRGTQVVQGKPPFVDNVLNAVDTWSFMALPADREGSNAHIAIVFQFASPTASAGTKSRYYDPPYPDIAERPSLPLVTIEPNTSSTSNAEASVILATDIDSRGVVGEIRVVNDPESVAPSVIKAIRNWQFSPGKCAGVNCDSEMIIVVIPRQFAIPSHTHADPPTHSPED
jgi:hypothetical protein